jgi:hypothetical protein
MKRLSSFALTFIPDPVFDYFRELFGVNVSNVIDGSLTTEDGLNLTTESGQFIIIEEIS